MIVGIDPSYQTGLCILAPGLRVVGIHAVKAAPTNKLGVWERRCQLASAVGEWIHTRVRGRGVLVAVEIPSMQQQGRGGVMTKIRQGAVIGAIAQDLFRRDDAYRLVSIAPLQAKKALGLTTGAEKWQIVDQVIEHTNLGKDGDPLAEVFAMWPKWKREAVADAVHIAVAAQLGKRAKF